VRRVQPERLVSPGGVGPDPDQGLATLRSAPVSALKAGDVLRITAACSVQFTRPIMFRLIKVRHDLITYQRWIWLDGYELDATGDAVARREIFVLRAGLMVQRRTAPAQPGRSGSHVRG
jgi:hypothetical protein